MNTDENLNTESNDIAGNRIDGPIGNTATKPLSDGTVGAPRTSDAPPATSEQLADAEISVGRGGIDSAGQQENKEVNPDDLKLSADGRQPEVYGGNFGNSTQDVYNDPTRLDNQLSDASRGEFGAQGHKPTHGGFGNQNREADYEPNNSAEDKYYGGPGEAGHQHNSYRESPADQYPTATAETSATTPPPTAEVTPATDGRGNQQDTRNLTSRADAGANQQNDNSAGPGQGPGYAADYGHTSLSANAPELVASSESAGTSGQRNQDEDQRSSRGGYDNQGSAAGTPTTAASGSAPAPPATGGTPAKDVPGEGYADKGRQGETQEPDYKTGSERSGVTEGDAKPAPGTGFGSKGGSYDDEYAASQPGSNSGSPAKGDATKQERAGNYGPAAREEFRAEGADETPDHGAPRRNAGRDGEGDE